MSEKFSEPEPNVIESSAGFSIKVLGRHGMRYAQGARSVWIYSEFLASPRGIAMSKRSIRTWEGDDPREVTEAERDEIANNIQRAFDACGKDILIG
jgi:hypothetical protein